MYVTLTLRVKGQALRRGMSMWVGIPTPHMSEYLHVPEGYGDDGS